MRVLASITTVVAFTACARGPGEVREVPGALFVPARAMSVERVVTNGVPGVTFAAPERYPASLFLCELGNHLERQGWRLIRGGVTVADQLVAESGTVRGWGQFDDATRRPTRTVHQWWDDWLSPAGDVATYVLTYEYPEHGPPNLEWLNVHAVATRADASRAKFGDRIEEFRASVISPAGCIPRPATSPGLPYELGALQSIVIGLDGPLGGRITEALRLALPDVTIIAPGDATVAPARPSATLSFSTRRRRPEPGAPDDAYVRDVVLVTPEVRHESWTESSRVLFQWSDAGAPPWRVVANECRAAGRPPDECRDAVDEAALAFVPALVVAVRNARADRANGSSTPHAPLFEQTYHAQRAASLVVRDTLLAMPSLDGTAEAFRDLPAELRRLASRRAPTPVRLLDPLMVPLGTRLIGGGVLPPTGELDWRALHEQYGASGWLAFSAALVTADGLDGLIYYVSECGGICGESGYAWVRRDSFQAPWILVRKLGIIWA
jgi:hypothetical protein